MNNTINNSINSKTIITIGMLADILSGTEDEISLSIKKTAKKEGEIEPANLFSIF